MPEYELVPPADPSSHPNTTPPPVPNGTETSSPVAKLRHSVSQKISAITKRNNGLVSTLERKLQQDTLEIAQHLEHIRVLEEVLRVNDIEVPERPVFKSKSGLGALGASSKAGLRAPDGGSAEQKGLIGLFKTADLSTLREHIARMRHLIKVTHVTIRFKDLSVHAMVDAERVSTVGSAFTSLFSMCGVGAGRKTRFNILDSLTGYIPCEKLTLILGPPGCGKSTLMKVLSGRMHLSGAAERAGQVTYNHDPADSGHFLLPKLVDYVDQKDEHAPTLTVLETMEFSFRSTSGGHHSYAAAKDAASARLLDLDDPLLAKVNNVINVLGLGGCKNVIVGNGMVRGVSGGQKKRVTLGEFVVSPSRIKFLDSISNGLDAATTFNIMESLKAIVELLGITAVVALLQPPPEVFELFDDVILMSEGCIIYQGPRAEILAYFEQLGYSCPYNVDVADYLQELPTREGARFLRPKEALSGGEEQEDALSMRHHLNTAEFVEKWRASELYRHILAVVDGAEPPPYRVHEDVDGAPGMGAAVDAIHFTSPDSNSDSVAVANSLDMAKQVSSGPLVVEPSGGNWDPIFNTRYPGSIWFHFKLLLERQTKLVSRDKDMIKARLGQTAISASIMGSLFNNLPTSDTQTMLGLLFAATLTPALSNMSMIPKVIAERDVFYKHADASFYPTIAYVLAQTIVLIPLQATEAVLFSSIVYWSCGLSDDGSGSRFFMFMLIAFTFSMCSAQMFRLIAASMRTATEAQPAAGVITVLLVLFSGFIAAPDQIPDGWIWMYWVNPMAWALRATIVNEFSASDYDELICTNQPACTKFGRFGDEALDFSGFPTSYEWVWYGFFFLWGMYFLFCGLTTLVLDNLRAAETPTPALRLEEGVVGADSDKDRDKDKDSIEEHDAFKFDPADFAFQDVTYTVDTPSGEVELLCNVEGFFRAGTMTALMGSSGAGKTTLLDVLAGRKNIGRVEGEMFVNKQPKNDYTFRQIMGYVEQFDALHPFDTAREAVEFSAALRLKSGASEQERHKWVDNILEMLELTPIENMVVGSEHSGGMSFEQKKRLCIAIELAANPAILFLDEPTSGLDSRAAQVTIRCLRRAAESGRAIVCTIHQPSSYIFSKFDSLLLLQRGGQTVFFGELGEDSEHLVNYFESLSEDVPRIKHGQNPASWMLDVIGSGSNTAGSFNFHSKYLETRLCERNRALVNCLSNNTEENPAAADMAPRARARTGSKAGSEDCAKELNACKWPLQLSPTGTLETEEAHVLRSAGYMASNRAQARALFRRARLHYWRNPGYNFLRMVISVLIGLIFASVYVQQKYTTSSETISRTAVIFLATLFCGIVGLNTVITVTMAGRPAFYREQQSRMYNPLFYEIALGIVEVPYLLLSSLLFTVLFFFIVGFDEGDSSITTARFFWFWLFQYLYVTVMVFVGQFFGMAMPNEAAATVVSGLFAMINSNFCGFIIKAQDLPSFWLFAYWLSPLHYAFEGLVFTQFHDDDTKVTIITGQTITAEQFIDNFYADWSYQHRYGDMIALLVATVVARTGIYLAMRYLRHQTR